MALWPENERRHPGTHPLGKHRIGEHADAQEIDQDRGMPEDAAGDFGVAPVGGARTRSRRARRTPSIKNHLPDKLKARHAGKGIETAQKSNRESRLTACAAIRGPAHGARHRTRLRPTRRPTPE